MYSPSTGLVGTPIDVFMTSDSEGALMSAGGRWNTMGALYSVPDDMLCVIVMFPFGTELIVTVEAKMSAGVPTPPTSHQGVVGLMYTPVGTVDILKENTFYVPIIWDG
jgi:hypothetical protein